MPGTDFPQTPAVQRVARCAHQTLCPTRGCGSQRRMRTRSGRLQARLAQGSASLPCEAPGTRLGLWASGCSAFLAPTHFPSLLLLPSIHCMNWHIFFQCAFLLVQLATVKLRCLALRTFIAGEWEISLPQQPGPSISVLLMEKPTMTALRGKAPSSRGLTHRGQTAIDRGPILGLAPGHGGLM